MLIDNSLIKDCQHTEKNKLFLSYPFEILNTESTYHQVAEKILGVLKEKNISLKTDCSCNDCLVSAIYNTVKQCNQNREKTRLTKQISKEIHKNFAADTREVEEQIGNILSKYRTPKTESKVFYDITDQFNWPDGYFGKESSCWWSCYKRSRDTFKYHDGLCIRIYEGDSDTKGIGRCWIYPYEEDSLILFNAYGKEMIEYRNLLYILLGISNSKSITFYNDYESDYPYVNGQTGLLLWTGEYNKHKETNRVIVDWGIENGIYSFKCKECGEWVNFDRINDDRVCLDCV